MRKFPKRPAVALLLFALVFMASSAALAYAQLDPRPAAQAAPNAAGPSDGVRLTLLHANAAETNLLGFKNSVPPNTGYPNTATLTLDVGGVAAFKAVADRQAAEARAAGNAVLRVYADDAYLPSTLLACSLPVTATGKPILDAVAQRQIFDVNAIGNHEFDYGPDFLERFIRQFQTGATTATLTHPFVAANLDFGAEPGFGDLADADGLVETPVADGRVLGRSAIITDEPTGQRFGVVGLAEASGLGTTSSPRNVRVTSETLAGTAAALQAEIDRLLASGVDKIFVAGQWSSLDGDRQLVKLLRGVDIFVHSNETELLLNPDVPAAVQRLPGDVLGPAYGTYPVAETDAASRTVYIVNTPGFYRYVGRLDVEFDAQGEVSRVITETSYARRVIPESSQAAALGVGDAVTPDPDMVTQVVTPARTCLSAMASTFVARTEVLLDVSRPAVRTRESNAGNLIADAFLYNYDQLAAHNGLAPRGMDNPIIAVQNGGGIRQNAGNTLPRGPNPTVPGPISLQDTSDVLPFLNLAAVVTDVTPADVKAVFERSISAWPAEDGRFLQVGGVSVTYDVSRPVGSRVVDVRLADGRALVQAGQVVTAAPRISVVTIDFVANGGDGQDTFKANPHKTLLRDENDSIITYEAVLRRYLQSLPAAGDPPLPTISAGDARYRPGGEGRLVFLTRRVYLPVVIKP